MAKIRKYQQDHKLDVTEAIENMLLSLPSFSDKPQSDVPMGIQETIPECRRRILYMGKHHCVQTDRKGLNRLKEIPVIEICRICKLEKYHIPQSTEIKEHQAIATEIRDSSRQGYKQAGMKYCPKGGLWVFPSKCASCKTPCPQST